MCGIFCMLFQDEGQCQSFYGKHIQRLLENRGPDCSRQLYENSTFWAGTTLWHQGEKLSGQPLVSDGVVLLFNGDLYMDEIDFAASDTEYLLEMMRGAENEDEFLEIFKKVVGPFSIVCRFKNNVYAARDSLGRNTLLVGKHCDTLFLASVIDTRGDKDIETVELPPLGIFKFRTDSLDLFPYEPPQHEYCYEQIENLRKITKVNVCDRVINPQWLQLQTDTLFDFSFDKIINADEVSVTNLFEGLLKNSHVAAACDTFIELLSQSIKNRIERTQSRCKMCLKTDNSGNICCLHAHISVLFSGGVDCSIIACLADRFIDKRKPIDLLNVAFERAANKSETVDFNVPDRVTGLATLDELTSRVCPQRKWQFVEINVTRAELQDHRSTLQNLIYPLDNVLDESLGTALYFASRGRGALHSDSSVEYISPCRVILMGSGADELFGGYTRHRNAFKRSTPHNDLLQRELDLDWIRLPSRNLARDDRVIGDNGTTVRAPYIEERFVNFARSLSSLQRCYPKIAEGVGDKLLLRLCAYKLGLTGCCQFRKRALQFGSRIADKRQSARDKSAMLHQN